MKFRYSGFAVLGVLLLSLLHACGGGGGGGNAFLPTGVQTGSTQVSVTDAPGDFNHVYITVSDLWFHASATADPRGGGWLKYTLATPQVVDLLNLSNGTMAALWNNIQVPIGTYQQIRLFLQPTYPTSANPAPAGHTYFNEVVSAQAGTAPLNIPDAGHGIRLTGTFVVRAGGTLRLAIDFDAGHDIVEFHEGQDYILKPRLNCFDLDQAGAIIGKLSTGATFTNSPRFVIKAERLATAQEMLNSGATGSYHVIRRWTVPLADGSFILYPVSTKVTDTWDIVIRGLNTQTMIIKGVTLQKGSTPAQGATDLGTIATSPSGTGDYAVAGTITSPTGAWAQFYQTLPGAGESPYEIRFRHFNPLWGGFRQNFMLNSDQIQVATFSTGSVSAFTPMVPQEGVGGYGAVAGAMLFNRSTPAVVSSSTGTVQFTNLNVMSPLQNNSVSGAVSMMNTGMNNKMDTGVLFAVNGGMIVNSINIGTTPMGSLAPGGQIVAGGPYILSDLPGGFPGAFYGVDAVGWSTKTMPMSMMPYRAIAIPQIVDLRTGNDTATMTMMQLW